MIVTPASHAERLGSRTARKTVILLRYIHDSQPTPDGYVECSRRRLARALALTEREVRTALERLRQCAWLERRASGKGTSALYRLLPALAELGETPPVPGNIARCDANGETSTPVSQSGMPELSEHFRTYAWQHLMQRLLTANERPKRYGRGYSKPVLRATAVALHWFVQATIREGKPIIASVRSLARETGLTFRSAKRARARLTAWGLLTEQRGACALDYARLARLLFEDGVDLPPSPAVQRRPGKQHDG